MHDAYEVRNQDQHAGDSGSKRGNQHGPCCHILCLAYDRMEFLARGVSQILKRRVQRFRRPNSGARKHDQTPLKARDSEGKAYHADDHRCHRMNPCIVLRAKRKKNVPAGALHARNPLHY
jgi:hypothetical protein